MNSETPFGLPRRAGPSPRASTYPSLPTRMRSSTQPSKSAAVSRSTRQSAPKSFTAAAGGKSDRLCPRSEAEDEGRLLRFIGEPGDRRAGDRVLLQAGRRRAGRRHTRGSVCLGLREHERQRPEAASGGEPRQERAETGWGNPSARKESRRRALSYLGSQPGSEQPPGATRLRVQPL
jgi:hypothetical protein